MDKSRLEYDPATETLRYRSRISGKELLDNGVGSLLSKIGRSGLYEERPVAAVEVVFEDVEAAEYNASALEFLGMVAAGPDGPVSSGAKFPARSDFGIEV